MMASQPAFNEAKTTQVAAAFLQLHGGRMHYLKLLKLMYLTDRGALLRWGFPVTMDRYVAMDHGPVPSWAYDLVVDDIPKPDWQRWISPPLGEYEVELARQPAPTDLLSRAEQNLIAEVFAEFGHKSRWEIVNYVHTLREWRNPHGGAIPISIRDILAAEGQGEAEIEGVLRELRAEAASERALSGPF
ncbi:MAG TPA: Panacea domain-containing protein [Terriglobales bacterium]|nr:Panacea domain-containing protein [Terriglobales bacterium]